MTFTLVQAIPYAIAIFMLGFFFGIIAKVFKDQPKVVKLKPELKLSHAPWDDAQKAALNIRQRDGSLHPYTCHCGAVLIACHSGWACPKHGMKIVQTWAFQADITNYLPEGEASLGDPW